MAGRTFRAFWESSLREHLARRNEKMAQQIRGEDEDYILNAPEHQFVQHLVDRYRVEPLQLNLDGISASRGEAMIPAEHFPSGFNVYPGKRYRKPVLTFHIPVEGDLELLRMKPSQRLMVADDFELKNRELSFDVVVFSERPEAVAAIAKHKDEVVGRLERWATYSRQEVEAFNGGLEDAARELLHHRREQILRERQLAASLGIPIRSTEPMAKTYAVPSPEVVRKPSRKPDVRTEGYEPDPTISNADYKEVLQNVFTLGKRMEKTSATYNKFDEEELRDQFLVHLEPRHHGSISGETFNHRGKTDILITYEGANLFAAELGIWSGPSTLTNKIGQILERYLTWRDSKAAVALFVRRKDFGKILAKADEAIRDHPEHVKHIDTPDPAWSNHIFRLPADHSREIQLAVMLFHTPES